MKAQTVKPGLRETINRQCQVGSHHFQSNKTRGLAVGKHPRKAYWTCSRCGVVRTPSGGAVNRVVL